MIQESCEMSGPLPVLHSRDEPFIATHHVAGVSTLGCSPVRYHNPFRQLR